MACLFRRAALGLAAALIVVVAGVGAASASPVRYRSVDVDGVNIFYREAGDPAAPVVLLLHGFPTSSHMFRDLIPHLSGNYHVIAPDMPGFGFSGLPDRKQSPYTFEKLARAMNRFTEIVGLGRYAVYVFDYSGPVGFRMALAHPERIAAIVSQNGNIYEEGLSPAWGNLKKIWADPTPENRAKLRGSFSPERNRQRYLAGVADADKSLLSPDTYAHDGVFLARPGDDEIQLDLLMDYKTNIDLYPKFQEYLRRNKPPVLAVWGRNDPTFAPAGAEAFRRDAPDAEIRLLDTGHFALETKGEVIADAMLDFLARHLKAR